MWTIPKQEQWQSYLRGSLALTDDAILFGEYYYASNVVESQIAPSPESGLTMPPASPFYPGNGITPLTHPGLVRTAPIALTWRTTALGTRRAEAQTDTQRAVVGIEGARRGWDYQAALLWSKSDVTQDLLSGYPAAPALRSGVAGSGGAPFLNPFGDQSPRASPTCRPTRLAAGCPKVKGNCGVSLQQRREASEALAPVPCRLP